MGLDRAELLMMIFFLRNQHGVMFDIDRIMRGAISKGKGRSIGVNKQDMLMGFLICYPYVAGWSTDTLSYLIPGHA